MDEHKCSSEKKASLIVGGGGGIGYAIACHLAEKYPDKRIILADRRETAPQFPRGGFEYICTDLAKESCAALRGLDIDALYFTAGIGRLSFFETFSEAEIVKNFSVNAVAAVCLFREYYARLGGEENFTAAIVSSIAGVVSSPLYAVYSATKGALVKFIEAVNAELAFRGRKNRITDVAPGYIAGTGFHGGQSAETDAALRKLAEEIVERAERKEERFIPKEEVYGKVIENYRRDPIAFAQDSIRYKLRNSRTDDRPQVKIGYLTGTFDLFHIGHLNLLRNAKKYCDRLIVGVHPTAAHKNKEVFIPLEERMEILRGVRYVDEVIVCSDEDTDAYPALHYDYLFVGTDYKGSERFLRYEKYFAGTGVQIVYLPYTQQTSSTQIRTVLNRKIAEDSK